MTEQKTGDGQPPAPPDGDGRDDFAKRLKEARIGAGLEEPDATGIPAYGVAAEALRRATELVAGVVVGAFIGWWVDRTFGTSPFGIIGFFMLGAAAGIWNVVRMVKRYNAEHGIGGAPVRREADDQAQDEDK